MLIHVISTLDEIPNELGSLAYKIALEGRGG